MNQSQGLIDIAGRDFLLKQVFVKGSRRFLVVMSFALMAGLAPIVSSAIEGNLKNATLRIRPLEDYGYINQFLFLMPLLVWFTRYYFRGLEPALRELSARNVISMSAGEFAEFAVRASGIFRGLAYTWVPYGFGAVAALIGYSRFSGARLNTWSSPIDVPLSHPVVWLVVVATFLLYYLIGAFIVRMVGIRSVIKLFMADESHVMINALHPDKAGGLSPLGNFSLRVTPACLLGGVCMMIGPATIVYQYGRPVFDWLNLVFVFGYVIALTVVFFVPLLAARSAMKKAKANMLEIISARCNQAVVQAVGDLKEMGSTEPSKVQSIEDLTKLYEIADRMPIYPFSTENILRFASSVLWPLGLMLLEGLKESIK